MVKKVIDIIPPEENTCFKKEKRQAEAKMIGAFKKARPDKDLAEKKRWKAFAFGLVAFTLSLLAILTLFYSKASLRIKPFLVQKEIEEEIKVDVSQEEFDIENKIIPGELFEVKVDLEKKFQTSGEIVESGKAEGIITVYNRREPPRAVRLRKETRFLSAEKEKVFRAVEKIYIPPATFKKGKLVPGSAKVRVVAAEPGEDYNIGPSKFSVPGLAGSVLYYSVWAESASPMTGGYLKKAKVVADEDIKKAKKEMEEALLERAAEKLKESIPKGFVFSKASIFKTDAQFSCSPQAGGKAEVFACRSVMTAKTLCFKFSYLSKFAELKLKDSLRPGEKLAPGTVEIVFSPKNALSVSGKLILRLKVKFKVYKEIPEKKIISAVKGLSKKEIKQQMGLNYPEGSLLSVRFFPFWLLKAPKNPERIKIELTF